MTETIRPFPVSSLRESILARLNETPAHTAIVAVDAKLTGEDSLNARLAVMVNGGDGWTFMGYLGHTRGPLKDTEAGFEVRKTW